MKYRIPGKMILDDKTKTILREKDRSIVHVFSSDDETISVKIYGEYRCVSYAWLYGVAVTKLILPDYTDVENNVQFYWYSGTDHPEPILKTRFKRPYEFKYGDKIYRVCPDATSLMLTSDGKHVVNWVTGNYLKQHLATNGYYYVSYSHRGHEPTKKRIHRCVAFAWVDNPTPDTRYSINHIDGNPKNNNAENLEWCTPQENVIHGYYGPNKHTMAKACKVRDIYTGEVIEAKSISQMADILGLSSLKHNPSGKYLRNPIIARRYEFRPEGDETPWLLEGIEIVRRPNEVCGKRLYVLHKDGVRYGYTTLQSLLVFGLNTKTIKVRRDKIGNRTPYKDRLLDAIDRKFPGINIEVIDLFGSERYIVRNLETNVDDEHPTISSISRKYGFCRGTIFGSLYNGIKINGKYIVIQK